MKNKKTLVIGLIIFVLLSLFGWVWWNSNNEKIDETACLSYFEVSRDDVVNLSEGDRGYILDVDGGVVEDYDKSLNVEGLIRVYDDNFWLNGVYFKVAERDTDDNLRFTINRKTILDEEFPLVIEDLMKTSIIPTYDHLGSDVCLVNDDNGVLKYKIKHYYCTNDCYDETYTMDVTLMEDGSVVIKR